MITAHKLNLGQLYLTRSIAVLAGLCAVAVFLYGVFLMLAVEHTASRTALQSQIDQLTLHLSSLETQYLQETRDLGPQKAAELGYVAPTDMSAVFADSGTPTLSLRQ